MRKKKLFILSFIIMAILLLGVTGVAGAQSPVEEWVAIYARPNEAQRFQEGIVRKYFNIVVDNQGNVFVTGKSGFASYIIKYDTNGEEQWVREHAGVATAIAVDSLGNVCVTGGATTKYDTNGNQLWTNVNNASAMAIDSYDNVYIIGGSDIPYSGFDCTTVKYNSAGIEQWMATYNGLDHSDDWPTDIAVDESGNVFVTGCSDIGLPQREDYVTIKYDCNGKQLWENRYNGPGSNNDEPVAIAVDAWGDVIVTGMSFNLVSIDWATIKYDKYGAQKWITYYEGALSDEPSALVVDSSGNVYVTGTIDNSSHATVKYDINGNELWVAEGGYGLAIDNSSNVYVAGWHVIAKYDSTGNLIWATNSYQRDFLSDTLSGIGAIALDKCNNVYVTGTLLNVLEDGNLFTEDLVTMKYAQPLSIQPDISKFTRGNWIAVIVVGSLVITSAVVLPVVFIRRKKPTS